MTTVISGSFSSGFSVTTIQVDERSIQFREFVMGYAEELGFTRERTVLELRHLLELPCLQQESEEHVAELNRRRDTAIRQPR